MKGVGAWLLICADVKTIGTDKNYHVVSMTH